LFSLYKTTQQIALIKKRFRVHIIHCGQKTGTAARTGKGTGQVSMDTLLTFTANAITKNGRVDPQGILTR
jgi:hypothetical protein